MSTPTNPFDPLARLGPGEDRFVIREKDQVGPEAIRAPRSPRGTPAMIDETKIEPWQLLRKLATPVPFYYDEAGWRGRADAFILSVRSTPEADLRAENEALREAAERLGQERLAQVAELLERLERIAMAGKRVCTDEGFAHRALVHTPMISAIDDAAYLARAALTKGADHD